MAINGAAQGPQQNPIPVVDNQPPSGSQPQPQIQPILLSGDIQDQPPVNQVSGPVSMPSLATPVSGPQNNGWTWAPEQVIAQMRTQGFSDDFIKDVKKQQSDTKFDTAQQLTLNQFAKQRNMEPNSLNAQIGLLAWNARSKSATPLKDKDAELLNTNYQIKQVTQTKPPGEKPVGQTSGGNVNSAFGSGGVGSGGAVGSGGVASLSEDDLVEQLIKLGIPPDQAKKIAKAFMAGNDKSADALVAAAKAKGQTISAQDAGKSIEASTQTSNGAPVPGNVTDWIDQASDALVAAGKPPMTGQEKGDMARIIQGESGGDPNAINLTDGNAAAGIPSKGVAQVIDPTFASYKLEGHGNIWNPVDNILASYQYAKERYGSVSNTPGIVSTKNGGGYQGY